MCGHDVGVEGGGEAMLELLILTGLVTYRVTRFVIDDTLIDTPRAWFHHRLLTRTHRLFPTKARVKVYELLTCPFCLSVWVAAGTVVVTNMVVSVPLPVWMWLGAAAVALMVRRVVDE